MVANLESPQRNGRALAGTDPLATFACYAVGRRRGRSHFPLPTRIAHKLIPALPPSRIMPCIPSPRGGRPEACRLAGWVRRLRARVAPRSREASGTDLGTLRSLREELARPRRLHKPARQKRGPELSNRRWRSATGRADGGSIHPRRVRSSRKRIPNQRLAALRCPSFATTPAGSACGRGKAWARGTPLLEGEGQG